MAPRAWLGNYRVFTVPTPIGHVANTPEIIAAFEAAVKDGMDVVNFSGGGPQIDPANDALVAGGARPRRCGRRPGDLGGERPRRLRHRLGRLAGTAPDAISVAAVSNTHVFAPALDVTAAGAPGFLHGIPFQGANNAPRAGALGSSADQTLVDVGAIAGTDGKPVERHLCGPPGISTGPSARCRRARSPARSRSSTAGSARSRRRRSRRKAAGAVGIVFADNREGEANVLPISPAVPGGIDREPRRRAAPRLSRRARRPHDRSASAATPSSSRPDGAA